MSDFTPELDLYEAEAARRVGPVAARKARTEFAAHLTADYDARIELGASPENARLQALRAIGDLRNIARSEPADRRDAMLVLAPSLFLVAYAAQAVAVQHASIRFADLSILRPNVLVAGPALAVIVATLLGSRERSDLRLRPLALGGLVATATAPLAVLVSGGGSRGLPLAVHGALAFWCVVPAFLAHLASIGLAPSIALDREPQGAFAARLLAWPLGMLIVGHAMALSPLVPWAWVLTGSLLLVGMFGRRRLDVPAALAATILGPLANGQLESMLAGRWRLQFVLPFAREAAMHLAMLLILQGVVLGLWSLLRVRTRTEAAA